VLLRATRTADGPKTVARLDAWNEEDRRWDHLTDRLAVNPNIWEGEPLAPRATVARVDGSYVFLERAETRLLVRRRLPDSGELATLFELPAAGCVGVTLQNPAQSTVQVHCVRRQAELERDVDIYRVPLRQGEAIWAATIRGRESLQTFLDDGSAAVWAPGRLVRRRRGLPDQAIFGVAGTSGLTLGRIFWIDSSDMEF
jgi:hypothetical protein